MDTFQKDPDAVLDYQVDWDDWLGTDTISSALFSAETGITVDSSANTTTTATVILSGGTVGSRYKVTCHITTAAGLEDDRSFYVRIREK